MSKYPLRSLDGLMSIKHGFAFKGEYFSESGHYVVITPGNFLEKGGFKRELGKEKFYLGEFSEDYLHQQGDLITAMTEQAQGLLGSCALVPEGGVYLHNQRIGKIDVNEKYMCKEFVYYLFQTKSVRDQIRLSSTGSKVKHTSPAKIYDVIAPVPSRDEQKLISKVLSQLDKKIAVNNKINTELEAMAKLIYDYWFVQFDFPNENGKPYKSSGGKMVYNEELQREIPEGWGVKELREIEPNIVTGKTPATSNPENFGGEVPFICIGDVRGNMHITKTEQTLSKLGADSQLKKYVPKGAICVTCIASPGLVGFATEDSQTNQQLNTIVCNDVNNRYFLYFYLKDYFRFAKAKAGNTFANMNKDDFSSIKVIHPGKNTLERFSDTLNSSLDKILINSKENNKLAELRDWLLPMLMNGQVTVE